MERDRGLTGGSDAAAAVLGGSALAVLREAGIIAGGIGVCGDLSRDNNLTQSR